MTSTHALLYVLIVYKRIAKKISIEIIDMVISFVKQQQLLPTENEVLCFVRRETVWYSLGHISGI